MFFATMQQQFYYNLRINKNIKEDTKDNIQRSSIQKNLTKHKRLTWPN